MKKIFTLFAALMMIFSMNAATYLPGSWNGWNQSGNAFSGSPLTSKIELAANTEYKFKVKDGSSWYGNNGKITSDVTNWTFSTSDGDCTLQSKLAGVYTFTWDATNHKLSVAYPTEEVEYTYTIVGSSAALFGNTWDPSCTANDMTKDGATYTLTKTNITLAVGNVEYKVAREHAWGAGEYPSSGNKSFSITEAGVYDVTFTYDGGSNLTATPTLKETQKVIPTVAVKGSWDEWTLKNLVLANDELTATATINIATVGDYKFGVDVDGVFTANGATVSRESNFVAGLTGNTGDMTLKADVAGEYTFTWTFETNTLTVTYPELPTYNVTATVNPAETGSVEGAKEYKQGEQATLTATAAEGYEFVNWTKGEEVVTENPYTFTVTADVALVANFKKSVQTITLSYDITAENIGNRMGRQTISVEDENYGNPQLVIEGFSVEVAEYTEASLSINDETLKATATYTVDAESGTEVYTATATTADGSIIYNVTFTYVLPTTQNYELSAMGLSATVESEDGYTAYYMEGEAILGEELIPVEFMVDNFGNAEGMIGDIFALGMGEAEQEGTSLFGVVLLEDESGNTYRIEFVAEIEQPEVEIVVKEEVDVVLYNLNVEPQGTMGLVSAGTEELSFWLTLLPTANYYGGYMSDAFSNIWYNDEQLDSAYGDMHLYGVDTDDKVKFVVSFITTPDAEGNVTKYNFTLYPGDKPSDATGVDNLNSTVAPIKAIINGQLIISNNGVQYNAQGAILK